MKTHDTSALRNVALIGHGHAGKTSLAEALLFASGHVQRLGTTAGGTTVTDHGEDEHARGLSIRLALAHFLRGDVKVNLIDTPGYGDFLNDARVGLSVADTAVVVVDAIHGVEVQTERVWAYANELEVPSRVIVLNKMDRENADFDRAVHDCVERFGRQAVPIQLAIGAGDTFRGVVDLVTRRAYLAAEGSAEAKEADVPAELASAAQGRREALVEMVAEQDDALMEKFLEAGGLSDDDLRQGLRAAVHAGLIHPIACVSATKLVGIGPLAKVLTDLAPAPTARPPRKSKDGSAERACESSQPLSLQVFKTLSDPHLGRLSLFRVWSGTARADDPSHFNVSRQHEERCGPPLVVQGKEQSKVAELRAGDVGCFAKLKDTLTGDTLADKAHHIEYASLSVPEPTISFALEPKSQGDEEKVASALHKIVEEDLALRYRLDPQTKELVVSGAGPGHVEAAVDRIRDRFKVDVLLHPPRVPYRETITRPASGSYRHKKQTGGSGQFAEVHMEVKPLPRGGGFEFDTDRIFGGSISNNFFPSIEKGIRHVLDEGPSGGFPVVDVRCEVYDGKMHPVDSKDIAFQLAGRHLMKQLLLQAHPILLEPIMKVQVVIPEESMGDVMGDLSGRRGRVLGMEADGRRQVIKANVPLAEMLSYQAQLKSMTGGRGDFTMELDHYDPVPAPVQEKILALVKRSEDTEEA